MARWIVGWLFALACGSGVSTPLHTREEQATAQQALSANQLAAVSVPLRKTTAPEPVAEVAPPAPTVFRPAPKVQRPKDSYEALKFDVEQERRALAWRQARGEDVSAEARASLSRSVPALIEKWKGTRWSYSGTTTVPKKGAIACGYFVSTVLLHAGLDVDRVDLSRQASEQIIRTLVPDERIERFHKSNRDAVVDRVKKLGEGVYIAGLDTHIGFLVHQKGKNVEFCHSTERNRRMGVVCEDARTSPSFKSRYTVLGRLGELPLLDAWLGSDKLPTARKLKPQAEVMTLRERPTPPAEDPLPNFEWFYEDWAAMTFADTEA
jgi:hypothetical protein